MKAEFLKAYQCIRRQGADRLLKWLETTDFFEAPASTKFHGNRPGGLCVHSVGVFRQLTILYTAEIKGAEEIIDEDMETIAICGLLHDICKANYYKPITESGRTRYIVEDSLPLGHGEKSLYLIGRHIELTPAEAAAIRWHMGGWDAAVRGGDQSASKACERYPLVTLLQMADMSAAYIDEAKGGGQDAERPQ